MPDLEPGKTPPPQPAHQPFQPISVLGCCEAPPGRGGLQHGCQGGRSATSNNPDIVIVISKLLKRYTKAKRTRAPAYSRALRRIKGGFQRGSKEAQVRFPE